MSSNGMHGFDHATHTHAQTLNTPNVSKTSLFLHLTYDLTTHASQPYKTSYMHSSHPYKTLHMIANQQTQGQIAAQWQADSSTCRWELDLLGADAQPSIPQFVIGHWQNQCNHSNSTDCVCNLASLCQLVASCILFYPIPLELVACEFVLLHVTNS